MMSKATTPASPAEDLILMYRSLVTSILSPPAVSSDVVPFGTLQEARAAPGTTWRRSTAVSASLSAKRASKVSLGISAKASFVGANTVNGPSPESVSTRSAACTAANKVDNWGVAIASSAIVWVGVGFIMRSVLALYELPVG